MRGKLHIHWVFALIAAIAFSTASIAAERTDKEKKGKATSARVSNGKKVNVNTATKAELETLPGVGPSTADNIIAARPIKNVTALKDVSGIGEERLKDIRPLVTVGTAADRKAGNSGRAASSSRGRSDGDDATRRVPQRAAQPAAESSSTDGDREAREVTTGEGRRPRNPQRAGQPGADSNDEPRRGVTTGDTRRRDVPQRAGQPAAESSSRDRANNSGEKVNINTASQAELESLLGIGPVKAQAIIDNRPYERKEDVMNVKGIKDGTYEKIEDRITVR